MFPGALSTKTDGYPIDSQGVLYLAPKGMRVTQHSFRGKTYITLHSPLLMRQETPAWRLGSSVGGVLPFSLFTIIIAS
jgi:hypothetical protein